MEGKQLKTTLHKIKIKQKIKKNCQSHLTLKLLTD